MGGGGGVHETQIEPRYIPKIPLKALADEFNAKKCKPWKIWELWL